jgi:hypothetical protein
VSPFDVTSQALPLGAGDVDAGRLDALRRLPPGAGRKAAAGELEVMFLTQLMQEMRKTIPKDDFLPESPARSVYEGAFDRSVANAMAQGDPLGIVKTFGEDPGLKIAPRPVETVTGHQNQGRGSGRP